MVNPRIGSDLQDGRGVEEEKTVEMVENHVGGTRMGIGVLIPKVGWTRPRRSKTGRWSCVQAEAGHCGAREQIPSGSRPGADEPSGRMRRREAGQMVRSDEAAEARLLRR